jgi:DNA repair exonuclease SbcCD ATPase subunit
MKLIIKKISIKNFFSVGAVPLDIDFTQGLHAVTGKIIGQDTSNGVGKSQAFIDSIVFAFKGISIRNLNKDQMINKINGSDCEVIVWFRLNGTDYRIERGLNPNFVRLIDENKDVNPEQENDERSSLKEAQSEIDKKLGISTETLINLITLNINYSKPFLKLDAADRRQIFLDVMNTSIFGKMLERARKEYNQARQDLKVLSAELKAAQENLQTKLSTIKKINEYREGFEANKAKRLELIKVTKEAETQKLKQLEQSPLLAKNFQESLNKLNEAKEKRQKMFIETDSSLTMDRKNVQIYTNKIARLKANPVCSECNSPTTEGHAQVHILELEKTITQLNETIRNSEKGIITLKSNLTEIREKTKKCEGLLADKNKLINDIRSLKEKIKNNDDLISSIEKETFSMTNVITDEELTNAQLRVDIKKQELADKDKQLLFSDVAKDRLGDKGIKSFTIKKIVPVLNKKMNEYLTMFKANYTISFDSELRETLKSRRRDEFSYNNFSAGEQKRIDLALMFSLLSIARSRSSIDCNVLILDEILDSSLCSDGIASLVSFLKGDFRREFPDLCVYVISHKNELSEDNFNSIIRLKKENNFTKIDEIQSCEQVLQV